MTIKQMIFTVLAALMLGSLLYIALTFPNAELPQTLDEFGPRHVWLFVAPMSGIVLWFWALFDWGTREMGKVQRLFWLFLLIFTMGFGAIVYFVIVGLRTDSENTRSRTRENPDHSAEAIKSQ